MRFRDSVVWITGASSGIGEEMAIQFHAEGAHVVLSARREDEHSRVAATCRGPGETMILPLDITDGPAIEAAAAAVIGGFGRVDMLINNAGLTQRGRIAETSIDVYRRIMDVNFFGPLMLTKAVLPSMQDRKSGQIVCVTSVAGKYGSPMRSGYNAAKHAAHGLFDSLREEVAAQGIDVTLIVPRRGADECVAECAARRRVALQQDGSVSGNGHGAGRLRPAYPRCRVSPQARGSDRVRHRAAQCVAQAAVASAAVLDHPAPQARPHHRSGGPAGVIGCRHTSFEGETYRWSAITRRLQRK